MNDWRQRLHAAIEGIDNLSDNVRLRLKAITGFDGPFIIIPYLGLGTAGKLWVSGRVLEDVGFTPSSDADTTWRNLVNMYKRFETDEVPGARVRAAFHGVEKEVVADHEGYFSVEIEPLRPLDPQPWQRVELELLDPPPRAGPRARAAAHVLVPAASARFGIISDIDDTIISTNVTNRLRMILTVLLSNEHTRKPFEGVAAFYRALTKGRSGGEDNPIFYVSSSAWNLYTLLLEFMKIQEIPLGPLFLRDFGNHMLFSPRPHHEHKTRNIKRVLEAFPTLPFVLIGDSGEQDPEIYREIVREYPRRIRAVYIRSVDRRPARLAALDQLIDEASQTGGQLVLAPDSEFAAAHAAAEGLISTGDLESIRAEKKHDQNAPSES
jgi:phosphatidate phosphatase APP1